MEFSKINRVAQALPDHFKSWLLDLLGCSDPAFPTKNSLLPYAELSRTYSKMRNEAGQLLRAADSSGNFTDVLPTLNSNLEALSADDALTLASKLTLQTDDAGAESARRDIVDELESAKQRLLTTAGYLKCVQVCLRHAEIFYLARVSSSSKGN